MSHLIHAVLGGTLLLFVLAAQRLTLNTYVRKRLSLTVGLSAAYLLGNLVLASVAIPDDLELRVRSWELLVFTLAVLNAAVVLAINPFREDRRPQAFPGIVQDTILVGLYVLVATFVFKETLATTSAVGALVLGFALQDTLGNAFAGLAIQMEKPFRVGHWIAVGDFVGRVTEITWRATKLRTKTGNIIILPNNIVSKEAIINYSEPESPTRLDVVVGASYLLPPNTVKAAILEAIDNCARVLKQPPADVVMSDFADSAISYRARFWVSDYERDELARDEVRTAIYYSFHRHKIEIPWPITVEYKRPFPSDEEPAEWLVGRSRWLAQIDLFSSLPDAERERLAARARERLFGHRDRIVRQGDPGSSLFVVSSGQAVVTVDPGGDVATIEAGGYFGEMSLLTGEPRSATVSARGDCRAFEIDAETLRAVAASQPALIEQMAGVAASRRTQLVAVRDTAPAGAVQNGAQTLLLRIRQFLRLA
jgi:small-conductance mechanosensitive channel/CRP-like cAMP-binding protein